MVKNIYFTGIGGIGMSALARFFLHKGMHVAGYDLTETPLTRALAAEGATIHYKDEVSLISGEFRDPARTMVVFTPAVPADHRELAWFREGGFMVLKRSEMLGHISAAYFTMAVAGTHGKTTTTTLVAWLNRVVTGGGSAFLGGISKNFGSNLVLGEEKRLAVKADELPPCADPRRPAADKRAPVGEFASQSPPRLAVEADEFDRSFLRLYPDIAVITSVDPDHLDIYGTHEAVREAFSQFTDRVEPLGAVILNKKVDIEVRSKTLARYTYSLDDPTTDFYATDITPVEGGHYSYNIVTPREVITDCRLGITGRINVENSIAAVAMMWVTREMRGDEAGTPTTTTAGTQTTTSTAGTPAAEAQPGRFSDKIREGLATFEGVKRRFDIHVNTPSAVYMDDYAHHPDELRAALGSLRGMFPGRRITAVFQPHLYTRTRDFAREFSEVLSGADELVLTPIYPARELPIEGVDSEMIGAMVTGIPWRVVEKERLAETLAGMDTDVVVTFGAGNIENHCAEIAEAIKRKSE